MPPLALQALFPASMQPEPVIWVATHIGFNNVRKCPRILYNILLQIPGPMDRDFLTKD